MGRGMPPIMMLLAAAALVFGCVHQRPLDVARLASAPVCRPAKEPSLVWIDTVDQWMRWRTIAAMPEMGGSDPTAAGMDFTTHGILVMRLGQRASAGTRMTLITSESVQQGDMAVIAVRVDDPIPGGRTAQMTIAPCLAVRMARAGVASIRVVDGAGAVLGELMLPRPRM